MKLRLGRLLFGASFLALATGLSGAAQADENYTYKWYFGGGGGWASAEDLAFTVADPEDGYIVNARVGRFFSDTNWRGELELSHRWHDIEGSRFACGPILTVGCPTVNINGDFSVTALMFNMLYDFNTGNTSFNPYFGAGLGGANVKVDLNDGSNDIDESDIAIAGQLLAGIQIALAQNTDLDIGYRYFDTLGVDYDTIGGEKEESFGAHAVTANLIWKFGAPPAPVAPPPAPPAPPPAANPNFLIYFPFDRSDLTPEAQDTVNEIARTYKDKQIVRLVVAGHTDTSGSNAYNEGLAVRRAESVKAGLIQAGIPANLIVIEAYGETRPAVATGDGVKEPLNRRAEVVVVLN